ncbi:MAG: nucleoside monophosphate kinase [Candidatus Saccharibacteria bacterium]
MILFFGPAGSGKSAQAQMMVDNEGFNWLSMGQLLRDTPDEEVHEFQRKGILVPLEKTNEVLSSALQEHKNNKKLLLDGYPRSLIQAQWFIDNCKSINLPIDLAINFNVNMEELLKRMELRGRSDDTPESIKERLGVYQRESDPIFKLLAENGVKVVHVDGVGSLEEIHSRVVQEVSKLTF